MLNEDRIRVMTKLAVLEQEHGKENEIASKFYKNDYVSYNMIWTGIMTTIAFGLGLLLFFLLNFEGYMERMHTMDLVAQGKIVIMLYICVLAFMLILSWFIYRKRYVNARKGLKEYCDTLHLLEKIYNQERHREHTKHRQEVES